MPTLIRQTTLERHMKRTVAESAAWGSVGAGLIGTAIHWMITPMSHAGASSWTTARVGVQLALGVIASGYAAYRVRIERRIEREDAHLDRTAQRTLQLPKDGY